MLKESATKFSPSAAALWRRDQGKDKLNRTDIWLAISAYGLSEWLAVRLRTVAGYLPVPFPATTEDFNSRTFSETLISSQHFPAFVRDPIGNILAWNHGLEVLWHIYQNGWNRPHGAGDLFSQKASAIMQDAPQNAAGGQRVGIAGLGYRFVHNQPYLARTCDHRFGQWCSYQREIDPEIEAGQLRQILRRLARTTTKVHNSIAATIAGTPHLIGEQKDA